MVSVASNMIISVAEGLDSIRLEALREVHMAMAAEAIVSMHSAVVM